MARLKLLRVFVIVLLAFLAFQFELGIAVNLSPSLQEIPPLPGSVASMWEALARVGGRRSPMPSWEPCWSLLPWQR